MPPFWQAGFLLGLNMYEISVISSFSAAHRLRDYQGNCVNLHGHNWEVCAVLQSENLDEQGICIDFRDVKGTLNSILDEFDHSDINEHPDFTKLNPTSENLAKYIYERLQGELQNVDARVVRVEVAENANSRAAYFV